MDQIRHRAKDCKTLQAFLCFSKYLVCLAIGCLLYHSVSITQLDYDNQSSFTLSSGDGSVSSNKTNWNTVQKEYNCSQTTKSSLTSRPIFKDDETQLPHIDCNQVGNQNFLPNWTRQYRDEVGRKLSSRHTNWSESSTDKFLVPNIVHYTWYVDSPKPFQFIYLLSMLSVHKAITPDVMYFHTNIEPTGQYWEEAKQIPALKVVHQEPYLCLFGYVLKAPRFHTSRSNVERLRALFESGGIYLDLDVLVIQSFDPLRRYPCTIGLESPRRVCGGIIICAKDAAFLALWINAFLDNYRVGTWSYNSGEVPYYLYRRFPHLIHIEKDTLHRPNWEEFNQIYGNATVDWRSKYAIHLWNTAWKKRSPSNEEPNPENIKKMNSTFGQIARWIYYGSSELL